MRLVSRPDLLVYLMSTLHRLRRSCGIAQANFEFRSKRTRNLLEATSVIPYRLETRLSECACDPSRGLPDENLTGGCLITNSVRARVENRRPLPQAHFRLDNLKSSFRPHLGSVRFGTCDIAPTDRRSSLYLSIWLESSPLLHATHLATSDT